MNVCRYAFALAAIALLPSLPAAAATSATVTLAQQNGSGESGTAVLTTVSGGVQVVVTLTGAPSVPQPAHIHKGTCSSIGDVAYALTSLVNGKSTTLVKDVTVDQLMKGPYAINIHKSANELGVYVACGNIAGAQGSM